MNGALSLGACAIIVALGMWLFGGFILRACGALLAVGGLASTALTGSPGMAISAILGSLAWLAGHWLFGLRYHYYRSPLARRVFIQWLPARFDPTRGWGVPNVPAGVPAMSTSAQPGVTTSRKGWRIGVNREGQTVGCVYNLERR